MPLATSTSKLPQMLLTSLAQCSECGEGNSDVSHYLDRLYMPHGKYSRFFGQKLRYLGKGVVLRAGRATTSYLRRAIFGTQVVAVVTKIWKIWDGFHKELYLYGHPLHLRPLQGLCVPSIIGVYSTSEGLANMAMEPPHPHAWRVADRSISTAEKSAIVEAYIQIHARGVLHGDVALKHMLIGKDRKPTIINFRHASCLQPAMEIGLGGCNAHEFQLEMRQVKFLLDYQGAREFEYRLARKNRSATRMNTHEGDTLIVPFPIPETTLRQWDESTLDDLPPPPLPFYVPGAPDVSIRPVSWIPGDQPLSVDDLLYLDSEANQRHTRTGFEISPIYSRLRQVDDDDIQPSPSTSPSDSRRKGKQPERNFKSDVLGHAPTQRHKRGSSIAEMEEELPDTRHLRVAQAGVTSRNPFGPSTSTGNLELGPSFAQRPTVISSDNCLVSRTLAPSTPQNSAAPSDEFVSPLLSHDIENSLLFSWAPMSPTTSHAPPPGDPRCNLHHSRPTDKIPMAHHEFTPQLDYTLDSPSDTSDSDADTHYGWADSETSSPEGALVTLQDDVPPFPTFDYPDIPLLFNPSSDANIEFPEEPLLESIQPSFKTRELITSHYKRKRLFLTEEDEYGERVCKQRRIEL